MGDVVTGTTGRQLVDPLRCNSIGQLPGNPPALHPVEPLHEVENPGSRARPRHAPQPSQQTPARRA